MFLNNKNQIKGLGLIIFIVCCWFSLSVKSVVGAPNVFKTESAKQIIKLAKSADIKAFMNLNADPCDDFYAFACGNWKSINPAQFHNEYTDKFSSLSLGFERKLQNLLLKNTTSQGEVETKVKNFYKSCLKTKTDNVKYREALSKIYQEFGEFSALKGNDEQEKNQTNFEWWSTVAKIHNKYGKAIMLKVDILDDFKDKSKTMVYIGLPQFEMTQQSTVHIEEDYIRKTLNKYLKIEPEKAESMAENILAFEMALTWSATDARLGKSEEELITLYNTTDFCEKYKDLFDFRQYLELVLGTKRLPPQVYIFDEPYLEGFYEVFNSTEDEVVEDYILWLYLKEFIIDITQGDLEPQCVYKIKEYFMKFIDQFIYNQYRSPEGEADIYELWDDIKRTYEHNLQADKYYWMSNQTREEATRKLINMNLTINSYDNYNFVEFFKTLKIDPEDYVLNVKNILEHAESLIENKLEKRSEEDAQMLSFTPSYNKLENRIKIPVALLQPRVIWDPLYPKAVQYGTLGFLIAHEMIHGFDDEGRLYDANGNAQSWWDEKSTYEFESRRKCFQEQYHKYKYDGKFLPENGLQAENIADNGGISIAYDAYKRWLAKGKANQSDLDAREKLPRLDFNNRQLFFISFAQIWCEDIYSLYKSRFASHDKHSPAMYRVIGSLSNSREFSWLFKCNKKQSKMDPAKKCEIY